MKFLQLLCVVVLLVFTTTGANFLTREATAAISINAVTTAANVGIPRPIAHTSRVAATLECNAVLGGIQGRLLPASQSKPAAKRCLALAEAILKDTPTSAFAHFTAAQSAVMLAQPETRDLHLKLSRRFGQHEGWLAQKRLAVAITYDVKPNQLDLQTLLATQFGAEYLARQFLAHPNLRSFVTLAANNATASDQQRLLNLLKKFGASA